MADAALGGPAWLGYLEADGRTAAAPPGMRPARFVVLFSSLGKVPVQQILLVIHVIIALALVAVILMQRSEGGGLGIGGGGGGGVVSPRGSANFLTRATAVLAALFMGMSLLQATIAARGSEPQAIIQEQPVAPAEPAAPQVPLN